jgi:hypothetical protein
MINGIVYNMYSWRMNISGPLILTETTQVYIENRMDIRVVKAIRQVLTAVVGPGILTDRWYDTQ